MHKTGLLPLLTALIAVAGTGAADSATAAKGDRTAYVAGGKQVTLAKSRLSTRELKARRPQMSALIPKVR